MTFSEVDIFRECAANHSDIAPNQALGEHTYAAVWSALRAWLLALFGRCRGGVFPNFARIAWHRIGDQLEDGVPMLRPIFVPSDAYLRTHLLHTGSGVTRASNVGASELEPCEEYSAMKIAIKYSCSLNKDVVFCCTRHLLHQLGETLRSGRPVSLDLGVGLLTGRDRCLAFRFHSQYLAHWPAAAAAAAVAAARSAAAAAPPPPPPPQRLVKSEGGRAGAERAGGGVKAPRSGSAGGVGVSGACAGEAPEPSAQEGRERRGGAVGGGGAGANGPRPGSPGRREYFASHQPPPVQGGSCAPQEPDGSCAPQGHGLGQRQQQQQPQEAPRSRSPGPGEAGGGPRQPGRDTAPPAPASARNRPAWGVRVPPPPPSPGRRSANAAATGSRSPGPSGSTGAGLYGTSDAPASPGARYRYAAGQAFQQHPQLSYVASEGMPYSPGRNGGGGVDLVRGSGAAIDEAMPVGRAVQMAVRTPRQRPASPGAHAHPQRPSGAAQTHVGKAQHSLQSGSDGGAASGAASAARPLSAPRCWPATAAQSAGGAVEAAAVHGRRAYQHPSSPRLDGGGAAAAARPAWGAGHGARARASTGGGGAVRSSSTPRLRSGAAAVAVPVTAESSEPVAAMAAAAEPQRELLQEQRVATGWATTGDDGGGGGSAGGIDVRQLWSPDSNLAGAAVRRGRAGGPNSVRRLFGGGDSQAHHIQRQQQQHCAAASSQHAPCAPELDDQAVLDQLRPPLSPPSSQPQQHQHQRYSGQNGQQPQRQQAAPRKPLFLTPQKDAAPRTMAAGPAPAPGTRGWAGRQLLKSPQGGGDEEPADHSPQLRRDQSVKSSKQVVEGSPRSRPKVLAQGAGRASVAAANGPGCRPQRTLVRALSPRTEAQQYNMRYGTPARVSGQAASAAACQGCNAPLAEEAGPGWRVGSDWVADVWGGGAGVARTGAGTWTDGAGQSLVMAAAAPPPVGVARDGARLPARTQPSPSCGAGLGTHATAAAAPAWGCDANRGAGTWPDEAAPRPPPGAAPASCHGSGGGMPPPRDGLLAGVSRDGKAAGAGGPLQCGGGPAAGRDQARHDAAEASFVGAGSSSGSLVLTGRSIDEENGRAAAARRLATGSSSGGGTGDLSSSCCAVHSIDSVDVGYPLPLFDSSIDCGRSSSSGGGGAANGPKGSSLASAAAAAVAGGACTAAVRTALGRKHRDGGGSGGRDTDRSQPRPRVVDLNWAVSPRRDRYDGGRYGDAFPVPMIITEGDLPQPAWGPARAAQQQQQPRSGPTRGDDDNDCRRGGGCGRADEEQGARAVAPRRPEPSRLDRRGASLAAPPSAAERRPWEEDKEQEATAAAGEEEGCRHGVVDCSAASSAELCWSARSARQGYGADAAAGLGRSGGAAAAFGPRYRRAACGGATTESEAEGGPTAGGGSSSSGCSWGGGEDGGRRGGAARRSFSDDGGSGPGRVQSGKGPRVRPGSSSFGASAGAAHGGDYCSSDIGEEEGAGRRQRGDSGGDGGDSGGAGQQRRGGSHPIASVGRPQQPPARGGGGHGRGGGGEPLVASGGTSRRFSRRQPSGGGCTLDPAASFGSSLLLGSCCENSDGDFTGDDGHP